MWVSGLAVLVSTARRARLLGRFLHLAAVSPQVSRALHLARLLWNFAIYPTVLPRRLGRIPEALLSYEEALAVTDNEVERSFLAQAGPRQQPAAW